MPYTAITDRELSVIKAPPIEPSTVPVYNAGAPASRENYLLEDIYQLRFRFLYDDKERSVWGPVSTVPVGEDTDYTVTFYTSNGYAAENQYYMYDMDTDIDIPDDSTITKMEVSIRRTNNGPWIFVEDIDIVAYRGATYTYTFDNSKVTSGLDQSDVARPYDYVPQLAGAQQIIGGADGSYLLYGDITEGYYNLPNDLDVTLSYVTSGGAEENMEDLGAHWDGAKWVINNMGPEIGSPEILICGNGQIHRYSHPCRKIWDEDAGAPTTASVSEVRDFFIKLIGDDSLISSVAAGAGDTLEISFKGTVDDSEVVAISYQPSAAYRGLKTGANGYYGIVYRDEYGRAGAVQEDDTTQLYVPSASEDGGACNVAYWLKFTLAHTPPIWAYSWELVYGGSDIAWFQQFLIRTHDRDDRSAFIEDGKLKIKINEGINNVRDELPNYAYPNYIWQDGDRLRVLGTKKYGGMAGVTRADDYFDVKIDWFDGVYIYLSYWGEGYDLPDVENSEDDILVEIYRKVKDVDNRLFYGVGISGTITDPGESTRTHTDATNREAPIAITYMAPGPLAYCPELGLYEDAGALTSTSTTTTTTTTTTSTTTTTTTPIPRITNSSHAGLVSVKFESRWISLFMNDSDVAGVGQIHIANPDADTDRLTNIRYSGIFINKTFINKLNQFEYDDDVAFDDKHGRIFGLAEVGHVLKVLQRSKITSLYIGREMSLDGRGNEQVIYTDNVLGSKHPAVTNYGTEHPGSILVTDRYMYLYDINNGCVIRDSANGQEEISRYGMESYFRDYSRTLGALSSVNVVSVKDYDNDLIVFSFIDPNTTNSTTWSFTEEHNRWMSAHSFIPEEYGSIGGKYMISFKDGACWRHNSDSADRCNYYGVQYDSSIWVVSNKEPALIKTFEAIELVSNKLWTAPDNDSIVIQPNTTYPGGMQSRLISTNFEEYEGVFRAAFLNDLLSGDNATANAYYLYNGRELRGREVLIKLENSETDEVNLFIIKVQSSISK